MIIQFGRRAPGRRCGEIGAHDGAALERKHMMEASEKLVANAPCRRDNRVRDLVDAIRDGGGHRLRLSRSRRRLAPLAFGVGVFEMLCRG